MRIINIATSSLLFELQNNKLVIVLLYLNMSSWCGCGRGRRSSSPLPWTPSELIENRWQQTAALLSATLDQFNQNNPPSTTGSSGSKPGSRAGSSASSTSNASTCNTTDTLIPLDFLTPNTPYLTPDRYLRRSSAESADRKRSIPHLQLIEHISNLRYPPGQKPPCVFCQTGKCSHTASTLSALSGGQWY